jgi:hypothetical protein
MVDLYRLALLLLLGSLFGVHPAAHAGTQYKLSNPAVTSWYPNSHQACNMGDAVLAAQQEQQGTNHVYVVQSVTWVSDSRCNEDYTDSIGGATPTLQHGLEAMTSREDGQGNCTALTGVSPFNANQFDWNTSGSAPDFSTHTNCAAATSGATTGNTGCSVELKPNLCVLMGAGLYQCSGQGHYTGQSCDPTQAPPVSPDGASPPGTPGPASPDPCPPGQAAGELNGTVICFKPADGQQGESTSTQQRTVTNPDGSTDTTTTTTTTTCGPSGCTQSSSSTTVHTPPGGPPGSPQTTGSSGNCSAGTPGCNLNSGNPNGTGLGFGGGGNGNGTGTGGGSFMGSCQAQFQCDGDAVMCATAKATNEIQCAVTGGQDEVTLYNDRKSAVGAFGTPYDLSANSTTTTFSASSFDTSNMLGSGAGLTDKTVTFLGRSVTIPFSTLNPSLEMLGNALVACAFLVAIMIVGRGR